MKEGARRSGRGQVTPLAWILRPPGLWRQGPVTGFFPTPLLALPASLWPATSLSPGPGGGSFILRLLLSLATVTWAFPTTIKGAGAGGGGQVGGPALGVR